MKKLTLLAVSLAITCSTAIAQHKHVHGEGRLEIAIENDSVTLNLDLPLDAAVGFERAPKTDKEKSALAASDKTLNDAVALWQFSSAAQCTLQSSKVNTPFLSSASPTPGASGKGHAGHADIEANYVFRCANPSALKGLETTLFKSFKRLYRLEAQRVGPSGQGSGRLTAKQPSMAW